MEDEIKEELVETTEEIVSPIETSNEVVHDTIEQPVDNKADFDRMYNAIENMASNFDNRLEKLASIVIDAGGVVKSDSAPVNKISEEYIRLEDLDFRI